VAQYSGNQVAQIAEIRQFINPLNTAAAIDRIIHKCETFNVAGPSWRAEAAKKRKAAKTSLTDKTDLA
jgi:DNA replication protein DnaC